MGTGIHMTHVYLEFLQIGFRVLDNLQKYLGKRGIARLPQIPAPTPNYVRIQPWANIKVHSILGLSVCKSNLAVFAQLVSELHVPITACGLEKHQVTAKNDPCYIHDEYIQTSNHTIK